ncbi:hypothetical protein WMY93_025754 [Mugilogobius chulae]|uniref:LRRNT domain-containing protein n=1 Tax=Mugilogobius chulae TaxID=88201 RepID=A0AAW0N033_9GOBI
MGGNRMPLCDWPFSCLHDIRVPSESEETPYRLEQQTAATAPLCFSSQQVDMALVAIAAVFLQGQNCDPWNGLMKSAAKRGEEAKGEKGTRKKQRKQGKVTPGSEHCRGCHSNSVTEAHAALVTDECPREPSKERSCMQAPSPPTCLQSHCIAPTEDKERQQIDRSLVTFDPVGPPPLAAAAVATGFRRARSRWDAQGGGGQVWVSLTGTSTPEQNNKMEVLTLTLVLFAVYGQLLYVSQAGQVKTHLTELEDVLLAENEEKMLEFNAGLIPDIRLYSNKASEHGLTPEDQTIISGQTVASHSDEDYDETLTQRLVREEEESMLVAGLYLDKRREQTQSSLIYSDHNVLSPTHVPLSSAPVSTPDHPLKPAVVPMPIGDAKSGSFLEDFIAEVLVPPTHSSTLEVNKRHSFGRIHKADSDRIKERRPDERTFSYNPKATVLTSTETQLSNVTQVPEVVAAKSTGNESKSQNKENKTKTLIKAQEKNVTAPFQFNKNIGIKQLEKNKKSDAAQKKTQHFPYFMDNYCPPECACYGRVVQCSDRGVDKVPYGIPYNSRYVLLMNNHINRIQLDLLSEYSTMEFLALTNNRLTDGAIEGAFEGVPALKRLYLDTNQLQSVPNDLPVSLEELRLDNNHLRFMSETAWSHCPGLIILSMSNNSLGNCSDFLPKAVLSPLCKLRTLNLDHNQLTSVPLGLPLSIKELYLKGNRIEEFHDEVFNGKSELVVLDLSKNRLTNRGLFKDSLINATHLESLNLEGNRLKQIPKHLPQSLKTLNLEDNLITSIKKMSFGDLKNLEHLGLARNKILKVSVGAFRTLPVLHQLDLGHNELRQVPRQLPKSLHFVSLAHNRIQVVPRDAFCWGNATTGLSGLVQVQLQYNVLDLSNVDTQAFMCLRGFQVVHFY